MTEDVVSVSVYWDAAAWQLARSAYVADLDDNPSGPDSFVWWLHQALDAHIARGPQTRAELADSVAADTAAEGRTRGFNRQHRLRTSTLDAVEVALTADRREANRILSRSQFLHEAVVIAAAAARRRRGGQLPPAPDRFPRGRPRGRVTRGSPSRP